MPDVPILIVDDNPMNLKLLRVLFTAAGYGVRTAPDGVGALAAIQEAPPKLILMDIQMPKLDGLSLTRQLKANPATSHIAVVATTGFALPEDRERFLAAGCDEYVCKPIDTRALLTLVARLLAEPRAHEA